MLGARKMLWKYVQTTCSGPNQQAETIENAENTMTVSKKFIKILKSSFKLMNGNYESQITEMQKKSINTIEVKMDRLFYEVIDSQDSKFDDCVTLALSYLYISYIHIDNKNDIQISKKYLTKSLELLKEKELDRKAILIAMRAHNELSYIGRIMQNIIEVESHLNEAMQLYFMFTKKNNDYPVPIDVASILDIEDRVNCKCLLENIYQATLDGLLYVNDMTYLYSKYTDIPEAAIYMHKLLDKQLNAAGIDHIIWAAHSAHLSIYFTRYGRFKEARNHLAAANFMIQQYFIDIYQTIEESNTATIENISKIRYKQTSSIIADYWAKYGLELLSLSRKKIIQNAERLCETSTSQPNESECSTKSESQPKDLLIFSDIEKDLEEFYAPITDECPLNYKEAKKVFVSVLKWFNDVKAYITDDTTENIIMHKLSNQCSIALGISRAYKYLAYYEQNKNNKIKLYKRQIDVIEKALVTNETEIDKQLYGELISSYAVIMDMMTDHLRADKPELSKEELLEVKQLASHCWATFKLYLNSSEMSTNH